jgi:hypothetical protein
MAFTYDPTTEIGKVRMRLRDAVEQRAMFTDAEISGIIDDEGSWRAAVVEGARILLMDIGRYARSYAMSRDGDSEQVDEGAAAQYLRDVIAEYSKHIQTTPTMIVRRLGSYPSDPYRTRS